MMRHDHTNTLRALAALLAYPDENLRGALPEIADALRAARGIDAPICAELLVLIDELADGELLDVEARYVDLFDRGRHTSLNLFEHVHGDGRERGSAMLDLRQRYLDAGLAQCGYELPDHLPVLLEYLSCQNFDEASELLSECAHVLRKLGHALLHRQSHYAAVPAALLALADEQGLDTHMPTPPAEDIDQLWEERPAFEPPHIASS